MKFKKQTIKFKPHATFPEMGFYGDLSQGKLNKAAPIGMLY